MYANDPDLVVIGSGVAGLTAALAAADFGARAMLITAGDPESGSSWWAQGGVAAAVGSDDRAAIHIADTIAVGASLNDERAVGVLVEEGRRAARRLLKDGVPFDATPTGPDLGLEAGHRRRRILHGLGGATGELMSSALLKAARKHPRVAIVANTQVETLVVEGGRAVGAVSGGRVFPARGVVLATGGYAGLWGRSTNPSYNRGSGLYVAWLAGASLADMEFVQFHPTALALPGAPAFLLSEALRGEGALLLDAAGEQVVNPLLPRDVVARAIFRHLQTSGPVYLSLRHVDPALVKVKFPSIAGQLAQYGLDLARDMVPVAPAAHYCMGGVRTDTRGRTDLPGLYAAGEVACTGAQGANRLASNSLLECLVFGRRAAHAALTDGSDMSARWSTEALPVVTPPEIAGRNGAGPLEAEELGEMLDRYLGVERDAAGLSALVEALPVPEASEVEAAGADPGSVVAALAARAALLRNESRGAHYRTDAPRTRPEWQGRIVWRRGTPLAFEEVRPGYEQHYGRRYRRTRVHGSGSGLQPRHHVHHPAGAR